MKKYFPFKINKQTFTVGSALLVRWIGTGVQFILNVILGRLLGADGVGVYYLFISSQSMLSNIGSIGFPQYTLRTVASLDGVDQGAGTRRFVKKAFFTAMGFTAVLTVFVLLFSAPLSRLFLGKESDYDVLIFAAVGSLFLILTKILAGALKGKGHYNLALGLETSAVPVGLLIFVGLIAVTASVSLHLVMFGYVLFSIVVFLIAVIYWWQKYHRGAVESSRNEDSKEHQIKRRPLFSFWGLTLLNTAYPTLPILLLPQFASIDEVGQFGVAQRLVTLASVILVVLNTIYSRRFARHYVQQDGGALQVDLKESQKYSLFLYIPFVAAFLLFAKPIMSIFGPEFISGSIFLWILAIGQLANSATGLVGSFLNMTEREGLELKLSILFIGVLLASILTLGSLYGAVGVAIAYAFTVAAKNGVTFVMAKSILKHSFRGEST